MNGVASVCAYNKTQVMSDTFGDRPIIRRYQCIRESPERKRVKMSIKMEGSICI